MRSSSASFFFFNDTATTEIYTLPYTTLFRSPPQRPRRARLDRQSAQDQRLARRRPVRRSEEHTSELQLRGHLVCRLLLEKKKKTKKKRKKKKKKKKKKKQKRKKKKN